ncbi:MAG: hypothetical protein DRJ35_02910 [Thermoprotei archaeon]|nr:MAG: hypothetical protein DRJ35_02910 [Thermoprotei archaeon]
MLSLKNLNLRFNPFQKQVVYDYDDFVSQPFLLTETLKLLQMGVRLNLQSESTDSIYYIILGERGSGKTTSLLFLKDIVEHEGGENCVTKYERSIKGMGSYSGLVSKLLPNTRSIYSEGSAVGTLKSFLIGKKYYWFIDVPDMVAKKEMEVMLRGLELLLGFKNISVVVAMNQSHFDRSFEYSEILGKFDRFQLKSFSLEECKELIRKRIEHASAGEPKLRFSEGAFRKVNEIAKGIPRNIISACNTVFLKYLQVMDEPIEITEDFVTMVLGESYAKKVLEERVRPPLREALWSLYNFIKEEFSGRVESESKLAQAYHSRFGVSKNTLRKRLMKLEKLGLISIRKSDKNYWNNVIEVVV